MHVEISTDREFLVAELLPVKALRNLIAVAHDFFAPEDSKEIFGPSVAQEKDNQNWDSVLKFKQ